MNAIVEIDESGRIVVPKKMRDALHFRAGDKLEVIVEGDLLTVVHQRVARGLYEEGGWLVYDSGGSPVTNEQANRWLEDDRKGRMEHALGAGYDL